jgi:hypothetical protein
LKRSTVQGAPYEIAPMKLESFAPGACVSLDCVVSGILDGTPFVLGGTNRSQTTAARLSVAS